MKKITIAVVLAFLCTYGKFCAQSPPTHKSLTVGDTLPLSLVFTNIINHPSPKLSLAEFSNKILLLDFWASWCTPCVKYLPKIDTLKMKLGENFNAILVSSYNNPETNETIEKFSERYFRINGKPFSFPIAIKDSTVSMLMDIPSLPHYVWIWNQKVIAITKKPLPECAVRELFSAYSLTQKTN